MTDNAFKSLYRVAEVELTYKNKIRPKDQIKVSSSKEAYNVFKEHWDFNKIDLLEQFKILLLNRNNTCLGISLITTGGTSYCPVDLKLIFATAIKANASAIIIIHNHPSGNPNPSEADITLTKKVCNAGKLFDIAVLDSLIITNRSYLSMADEGLMPPAAYTL